jgi:hypothetical protein
MGLLCNRQYDVGVESPPAMGQTLAWHSLGLVSAKQPQPRPARISYLEDGSPAAAEGDGTDVNIVALAFLSVSSLTIFLVLGEKSQ